MLLSVCLVLGGGEGGGVWGGVVFFFFQAEDGIRDLVRSRGLGDVYKRQIPMLVMNQKIIQEITRIPDVLSPALFFKPVMLIIISFFAFPGSEALQGLSLIHI